MKKLYGFFVSFIATLCCMMIILPPAAMADAVIGGDYNYTEVSSDVVVDAPDGYVNFRFGAGLEYGIIMPIANGVKLHVERTAENANDGLLWGQVNYNNEYGWISMSQTSPWVPQPETEAETEKKTGNATGDPQWDSLVTDAYNNVITIAGQDYSYVLPQINLESAEISELNQKIYNDLYEDIQMASAETMALGPGFLLETSYVWYLADDVLSVVIGARFGGPWTEYLVYNVSVSGQKAMDREDILELYGITEDEFRQKAAAAMEEAFHESNDERMPEGGNAVFDEKLNETLAEENLDIVMPYINGEGHLCIFAYVYLFGVQNSKFWADLDLND